MAERTRSFWGSREHAQTAGSVDIESEIVLAVRADLAYRLTGYRFGLSSRIDGTGWADGDHNFALALNVWPPSLTMSVGSALDSRQTQAGLFAVPQKGTLDVLNSRVGFVQQSATSGLSSQLNMDSGWVNTDLLIPSLSLTAITEIIAKNAVWQFWALMEYETVSVRNTDKAAAIAKSWGVPKPHETTW